MAPFTPRISSVTFSPSTTMTPVPPPPASRAPPVEQAETARANGTRAARKRDGVARMCHLRETQGGPIRMHASDARAWPQGPEWTIGPPSFGGGQPVRLLGAAPAGSRPASADETVAHPVGDGTGARLDADSLVQLLEVALDGRLPHPELVGELLVRTPGGERAQDLQLAGRETGHLVGAGHAHDVASEERLGQ